MATPARPKVFKNFINGEWIEARSGKAIENRNPANTGELVGMFPASTEEDVNLAIDAAKGAYDKWRLTPAPKRGGNSVSCGGNFDRAQGRLFA